jgi:hypothetical protein
MEGFRPTNEMCIRLRLSLDIYLNWLKGMIQKLIGYSGLGLK